MRDAIVAPLASLSPHPSRVVGDAMPAPLLYHGLGFLGLWSKRLEHYPRLGEGVSCQVTEDPDAPRPR